MLEKAVFRGFYACLKSVLFACVSCMMFVFGEISFAHADETYPFSITTITLPSGNNAFTFKMSAGGTFYVDCGTDGTLSGTIGVSGNTITRTTTDYSSYACSYTSGGVKTIRFGGTAVAYSPDTLYPAISFMNNQMIASLSGDLSALFPVSDNNIPTFYQTFYGCTSLTSIPSTLFSFGGNDVPAQEEMFFGTFAGCTGLKSIPSGLFSHIVSGASYAFTATFMGCSGLGTDSDVVAIPADLFSFGGNDVSGETGMFSQTFEGCEGLKSIPSGLFSHVISSAETMFSSTFADCANLGTDSDVVAIPNDLFSFGGNNVSGQDEMFMSTFVNCTGLKSIPSGLFSHVTSGAVDMFNRTFAGCEGLNGNGDSNQNFIPPSLFEGLINESNPSQSPYETDMMDYIFYDTTLRTRCPENYYQFITGYEDYWDGHVSCKPCPEGKTSFEGSTSIDQCIDPEEIDDPKSPAEITYPFSITTTELSDKKFQFTMSAAGTFYVDCGTDGTLSGDGVTENSNVINRAGNTTSNLYTCTYQDTESKTIRFGGKATSYNADVQSNNLPVTVAAISFYNSKEKVQSIAGNLSTIFPWYSSAHGRSPMFYRTFRGCTNITSIPENLFADLAGCGGFMFDETFMDCTGLTSIPTATISGQHQLFSFGGANGPVELSSQYVFASTFEGCTNLTSIPSDLFSRIKNENGRGTYAFGRTFGGCTALTAIPETLFSTITKPSTSMFSMTFHGCENITEIPVNLFNFGNTSNDPNKYVDGVGSLFYHTFFGCKALTKIPSGLFSYVKSGAQSMFAATFSNCTGLQTTVVNGQTIKPIPDDLFNFADNNVDGAKGLFNGTFSGCSNLTSIPNTLFSHVKSGAEFMFYGTFRNCDNLQEIPANLFNFADNNVDGAKSLFNGAFSGCSDLTSIPNTLFSHVKSGAEQMFAETFMGCTGLKYLPENLFASIKTPAEKMFYRTFKGCDGFVEDSDATAPSAMYNFIPKNLFSVASDGNSGLINESYPTQSLNATDMMTDIFDSSSLSTQCPVDYYRYTTGYESDWDEHVSCTPCPPNTHSPAGSDGPEDCVAGNILTYNCGIATGNAWSDENLYTAGASVPMPETIDEHCNASDLGRIFTGWICNGNIVPDENNQIVMPGEPVTCVARWDECDNANNYWWNIDNTECVQGHKITLKLVASCLEPQYPIEPTVLYTIPTRGAYLDEERTLLMSKTENPIQLPHVEFIANFDTNAPLNPDNNDIQYSVPEVASVNLNNYRYHCPFTMSPSSYGYNSFGNCFIHNHPVDYLTLSDTDHISGLTPENRNGYLTDDGIYQAEYQNQDQIWWINGCAYSGMPAIISPSLTGYTFDNWCTDVTGTMGCFKGQVPNTIAENTTYYAHWTPKHYTVTYNKGAHATENSENYVDAYDSETGEGGATFDAQYTALNFATAPISEHMSVATGYVFVGWTTDSTPIFDDGVLQNEFTGYEYWKRDSNLTVYAAYTCADGYFVDKNGNCVNDRSVTYDCNNGTEKQTVSYINGQTVVPDFDCTVPGNNDEYEFAGWYCSYGNDSITLSVANTGDYGVANKVYENFVYWSGMPGDGFSIDQNVHCIAVWQKKRIECPNNGGMSWKYVLNAPVDTQLADDYIDTNVSSYDYGSANNFTMNFTYGIVYAYSSCNTTQGVPGLVGEPDKNSYGNHCWCQVRAMSGSSNISFLDDIATWIYLESEDSCSETCRERCEVEAAKTSKGWLGDNDMSFREILYTHDLCNYRIDYDCGDGVVSNVNVVMGLNYELSTPASVCQIPTGYVVDEDGDDVIGGGWICNAEHANSFENQRLGIPDVLGNNGDIWTSYDNYMCQIQLECDATHGYYPKNGVCVNDYGITYTSSIPAGVTVNGMPDPLTVEVPAGTEYTLAPLPTATGYNITGWDCGEDAPVTNNTITMPSTGIACSLVWNCDTDNGYRLVDGVCSNIYTVTYTCGGNGGAGTPPVGGAYEYNTTVTTPTKEETVGGPGNQHGCYNNNIYTNFQRWTCYDAFSGDDGFVVWPGETFSIKENTTCKAAWAKTGANIVLLAPQISDWSGHEIYSWTYKGAHLNNTNANSFMTTDTNPLPDTDIPSRPGWDFDGYYIENQGDASEPSGEQLIGANGYITEYGMEYSKWVRWFDGYSYTWYAGWVPNSYGIVYHNVEDTDIWTGNHPETYTVGADTEIGIPVRPHYVFAGWCVNDENCENYANNVNGYTISASEYNLVDLYAVWNCDTTHGYYLENGVCVNDYGITYTSSIPAGVTVNGMPDPLTVEVPAGTENYELAPLPTATGYNITGWDCGNNVTVSANNTITMPSTGITCSLVWGCDTANGYRLVGGVCNNEYTITYSDDLPDGVTVNGMPDPLTEDVPAGTEEYELADLPTATGYNITGWSCKDTNNNTVMVSSNNTITMPSTGIACSLVWNCDTANGYRLVNGVCNNTYSVIYSCGESSGVVPTTNTYAIYGEQFTSANNTCDVPNGAVFAGWGVSGTDDIVSGSFTWNYTEDKTFTAVWGCDTGHGYQWNAAHDACVFVCDTGKWLHIGDERMCLYTNKPSSPALAIKIGEEIYYLRMESGDEGLKINDHSNKKFKIEREGILYNVSDISTL